MDSTCIAGLTVPLSPNSAAGPWASSAHLAAISLHSGTSRAISPLFVKLYTLFPVVLMNLLYLF